MNYLILTQRLVLALVGASLIPAGAQDLLFQKPAVNKTEIVFAYAGDLWRVPRPGGQAVRLTNGAGIETNAVFSPDGATVAFSGEYDGNTDIYLVPVNGGVPKRLTWHPAEDIPLAFSADGKQILFRSFRTNATRVTKLFTMNADGGPPAELPFPMGHAAAYSPDGKRLAYTPLSPAFLAWKRYAGGRTSPIWIADLADSRIEKVPRDNSNDYYPMWSGDKVYFLSDRFGPMTLCVFDTNTKKVSEAIRNTGLDYKSASMGPGAVALEHFGAIELFDLKSGKVTPVSITLQGDMPEVRPYYSKAGSMIESASISQTGVRAVFGARGEILTVPAEKGDIRNLTNTPGVAERYPAWSPDGQSIAYFSDAAGEYQLHIAPQTGIGNVKKYDIGWKAFFYEPVWSPDGKKILFRDSNLTVCFIDLETSKVTRIDSDYYDSPDRDDVSPSWAPDSKWIVYAKMLPNHLRAIHVYSLTAGKATQISDGLSDQRFAAFDKDGRFLFFTASTNTGLSTGWLDMSSIDRIKTRNVYVAVLQKDDPSPLAPESDEEKAEPGKKEELKKDTGASKVEEVKIDFDGVQQRILALPLPARNYVKLMAGKAGTLMVIEAPEAGQSGPPKLTLHKFDMKTRKPEQLLTGIEGAELSGNGEKMLYRQENKWFIAGTAAPPKAGNGALKTDQMEVRVEPVAGWKQIYNEVWRIERDFFYDPNLHGVNLADFKAKYQKYLPGIAHREDLNYLFTEMLGELSVGHLYVGGGSTREKPKPVPVGLLGADYSVENGRYRFAKVFNGENWNPNLRAPLTAPGVNVRQGEYLLEVNGRDVKGTDELYSLFEATAGKSVLLKAGPDPSGVGAREVTVVPVADETGLRYMDWVEGNRRKVEQLSGGRLGYVHLPNTSGQGYTNFNRWFFAQTGKDGIVLDERFNGGGYIADYIVDYLRRPLLSYFTTRAGHPFTTPMDGIFGPKAMIVNEYAGSGGDALPWMFRKLKIGPVIGKRTWGGLVGIFGFPPLIDEGRVTAPNLAFYNTEKQWDVENHGVTPDIDVEYDPALVRQGRDPQLEKAVEVLLESLKKSPPPKHEMPAYPNYHTSK
ncbi:MAG: PD40 domain-containing protein [Bryobacterales bacterium]|nr:PD40 domain-containing protein [Bryobacterales bacterium]